MAPSRHRRAHLMPTGIPDTPAVNAALRGLAVAGAVVRRPFARRPWTFEVFLFALALVVYQGSRALVVGDPTTAFSNAADIILWERSSGLFVEVGIQQWVLNHLELTAGLNWFYVYGHWTVTPLFFVWLYRRRRRVYAYVRNAFLLANGIALLVFMLYPVAPPRLVGRGFVDTLDRISDVDLQGGALSGWFNPHAAVPSMHFGYALMIAMVGLVVLRHWPLRLAAVAYPGLVFLTITSTGNHYVIDSVAGGLVVATGFVGTWAVMRTVTRARRAARPVSAEGRAG